MKTRIIRVINDGAKKIECFDAFTGFEVDLQQLLSEEWTVQHLCSVENGALLTLEKSWS